MLKKSLIYDVGFVILVTSLCHVLFSKYGFNPTDEGFVLSATNRVLHGQIPHVDFSSMRPLGYAYLHIPELLVSKTHFFLVSRFVFWLEEILIAFLWIRFLVNYTKKEVSLFVKYSLIIICFVLNVHYFPCSVLHTIDGLLMCMIGLNFIISEKKWNFIGFFFIGFAVLCKQNYLVVLPFTLFLFNRKNIALNIAAGFFPIVFYIVIICTHGGWKDLITQLSGHNELLKFGVLSYLFNPLTYIGIISVFVYSKIKINKTIYCFLILLFAIILLATNHYHGKYVFLFTGIICGEIIHKILIKENILLPFIVLLLAWCVSISVGYNTPALFVGGIISLLLFYSFDFLKIDFSNKLFYAILLIILTTFYFAKMNNIYRDLSSKNLTYKADNIVEGASGIYTNKNTFLVLQELDSLKKAIPNLVVVPDFTACNILHSHQSKILTEWPNKTEVPNEKILEKITSKTRNDSTLVYAIPVFQTALLRDGFTPQENSGLNYPIIKFAKENYSKISFSKYFEIRRK